MWKLLSTQLLTRALRPKFWAPTVAGLILVFVFYVMGRQISRIQPPLIAALLPLIPGILFACGGYFWLKKTQSNKPLTNCGHCNYDLQGHEDTPIRCPECGDDPMTVPEVPSTVSNLSLIPGCLLIFISVGCLLLTLLYVLFITSGTLSV
jgi:hypothetical protein